MAEDLHKEKTEWNLRDRGPTTGEIWIFWIQTDKTICFNWKL